jgi:uncharacterized membrane protein YcjF (UPF0283 family)
MSLSNNDPRENAVNEDVGNANETLSETASEKSGAAGEAPKTVSDAQNEAPKAEMKASKEKDSENIVEAMNEDEDVNADASNEAEPVNYSRLVLAAVIRIIAGAYVAYLGYNAITGSMQSGEGKWYLYAISVFLILAGAAFVVSSIMQLLKLNKMQLEEKKRMEEDPEYRKKMEEMKNGPLPTRVADPNASQTGADIRARLQAINEEEGIETEEIVSDTAIVENETADTENTEA